MIRVIVEFVPFGQEVLKETIFEGTIWNDLTGNVQYGNYKYEFKNQKDGKFSGEVKKYNRSRPIQDLASIVFKDICKKEKKSHGRNGKM